MSITIYTPCHDGGGEPETKDITFEEFRIYFGYHPPHIDQDQLLINLGWNKWELRSHWFPIGQSKEQLDALWEKLDEANFQLYDSEVQL